MNIFTRIWRVLSGRSSREKQQQLDNIMKSIKDVLDAVTAQKTVIDGLVTLTAGLKKEVDGIVAGSLTPEQQADLDSAFAGLTANSQEAADAIVANTPAAPVTDPAPVASTGSPAPAA
jgi:hypothetical protein